jgi:hypothetical protein
MMAIIFPWWRNASASSSLAAWQSRQPISASKCFELFHCSTIPGVVLA